MNISQKLGSISAKTAKIVANATNITKATASNVASNTIQITKNAKAEFTEAWNEEFGDNNPQE